MPYRWDQSCLSLPHLNPPAIILEMHYPVAPKGLSKDSLLNRKKQLPEMPFHRHPLRAYKRKTPFGSVPYGQNDSSIIEFPRDYHSPE